MDISDKNFRPCPCGYQICQFCYNNIRQNPELNGRCPGCRRLYDDDSVEYKLISAEEYRMQQIRKEKREREKKQREKEKKETEMANKKHLAGLRVVQKNLVYVTGLNPPCSPDDLHSVLRSDKYFGQYGKILKIVINRKAPSSGGHHSHLNSGLVVYVTFSRKEDALKCINELDGSLCDGRVLRAAHGTTKYCSSYLRGHPCPNPNCMFLHEPGEEADLYTRKDLLTQQGIKMGMIGLSGQRVGSSSIEKTAFNAEESSHSEDDEDTEKEQDLSGVTAAAVAGPTLPVTAHWAKSGNGSASASPSVNPAVLTNAAAFPTLGEIFKDQKQQPRKEKLKIKARGAKDAVMLPDDVDIDDDLAIQFVEETADYLKGLSERREKLKVHFSDLLEQLGQLPLFLFDSNANYSNDTKLEEEKIMARQVIERFLLKPIKNYHLAYQNHPITQQQALLQQQMQTPKVQAAQLQQLQLEQQRKLEQDQLLQLQPQVLQVKRNDRAGTATPPPPGLFAERQQQQAQPAANQLSSSQLLTQLMSGKR